MEKAGFPHAAHGVYLDHAGATLYSAPQMAAVHTLAMSHTFGNPHTAGGASERTARLVHAAREQVLRFLGTDGHTYTVVFTSGATASMRLVGEVVGWGPASTLAYTAHNHTSVLGLRGVAASAGARVVCVDQPLTGPRLDAHPPAFPWEAAWHSVSPAADGAAAAGGGSHLFVLPAECNFSGVKADLRVVSALQAGVHVPGSPGTVKWHVLLDVAKFVAASPLDLSAVRPAFAALSFYKMFGWPTGLGALLVRNDVAASLRKPYFGGGTMAAIATDSMFAMPRETPAARLEDGTVDFLGILSLAAGFDALEAAGGMASIRDSGHALTQYAYRQLLDLHRTGGAAPAAVDATKPGVVSTPACDVYGNHAADDVSVQGPVLTFNLKAGGGYVAPSEVGSTLALHNISVRTGCFCNPGACQRFLGMSAGDVEANLAAGHVCGDGNDLIDGRPVGAVRVSFGYMTTRRDVDALLSVLRSFYGADPVPPPAPAVPAAAASPPLHAPPSAAAPPPEPSGPPPVAVPAGTLSAPPPAPHVTHLTVFPLKSCRGMGVHRWPLGPRGLLYDREWCVADEHGHALTQKTEPRLALVECWLAPPDGHDTTTLRLSADGFGSVQLRVAPSAALGADVVIPEASAGAALMEAPASRTVTVCGATCRAVTYSAGAAATDGVSTWLSAVLKRSVAFVRVVDEGRDGDGEAVIGFANNGQFLVVSDASVAWLQAQMQARHAEEQAADPTVVARKGAPPKAIHASFFRPNITVGGAGLAPFDEDSWSTVYVGGVPFVVTGDCQRCRMINIDQTSGRTRPRAEPLLTLSKTRRRKGGVFFGRFLASPLCTGEPQPASHRVLLEVGMLVRGSSDV